MSYTVISKKFVRIWWPRSWNEQPPSLQKIMSLKQNAYERMKRQVSHTRQTTVFCSITV